MFNATDWLGSTDARYATPMRVQHDIDISVGYMHSGYPFMTFMDVVNSTLNTTVMKWCVTGTMTCHALLTALLRHMRCLYCNIV